MTLISAACSGMMVGMGRLNSSLGWLVLNISRETVFVLWTEKAMLTLDKLANMIVMTMMHCRDDIECIMAERGVIRNTALNVKYV